MRRHGIQGYLLECLLECLRGPAIIAIIGLLRLCHDEAAQAELHPVQLPHHGPQVALVKDLGKLSCEPDQHGLHGMVWYAGRPIFAHQGYTQ